MGNRLRRFLSELLPQHVDYETSYHTLRQRSLDQLETLHDYLYNIATLIDKNEHERYIRGVLSLEQETTSSDVTTPMNNTTMSSSSTDNTEMGQIFEQSADTEDAQLSTGSVVTGTASTSLGNKVKSRFAVLHRPPLSPKQQQRSNNFRTQSSPTTTNLHDFQPTDESPPPLVSPASVRDKIRSWPPKPDPPTSPDRPTTPLPVTDNIMGSHFRPIHKQQQQHKTTTAVTPEGATHTAHLPRRHVPLDTSGNHSSGYSWASQDDDAPSSIGSEQFRAKDDASNTSNDDSNSILMTSYYDTSTEKEQEQQAPVVDTSRQRVHDAELRDLIVHSAAESLGLNKEEETKAEQGTATPNLNVSQSHGERHNVFDQVQSTVTSMEAATSMEAPVNVSDLMMEHAGVELSESAFLRACDECYNDGPEDGSRRSSASSIAGRSRASLKLDESIGYADPSFVDAPSPQSSFAESRHSFDGMEGLHESLPMEQPFIVGPGNVSKRSNGTLRNISVGNRTVEHAHTDEMSARSRRSNFSEVSFGGSPKNESGRVLSKESEQNAAARPFNSSIDSAGFPVAYDDGHDARSHSSSRSASVAEPHKPESVNESMRSESMQPILGGGRYPMKDYVNAVNSSFASTESSKGVDTSVTASAASSQEPSDPLYGKLHDSCESRQRAATAGNSVTFKDHDSFQWAIESEIPKQTENPNLSTDSMGFPKLASNTSGSKGVPKGTNSGSEAYPDPSFRDMSSDSNVSPRAFLGPSVGAAAKDGGQSSSTLFRLVDPKNESRFRVNDYYMSASSSDSLYRDQPTPVSSFGNQEEDPQAKEPFDESPLKKNGMTTSHGDVCRELPGPARVLEESAGAKEPFDESPAKTDSLCGGEQVKNDSPPSNQGYQDTSVDSFGFPKVSPFLARDSIAEQPARADPPVGECSRDSSPSDESPQKEPFPRARSSSKTRKIRLEPETARGFVSRVKDGPIDTDTNAKYIKPSTPKRNLWMQTWVDESPVVDDERDDPSSVSSSPRSRKSNSFTSDPFPATMLGSGAAKQIDPFAPLRSKKPTFSPDQLESLLMDDDETVRPRKASPPSAMELRKLDLGKLATKPHPQPVPSAELKGPGSSEDTGDTGEVTVKRRGLYHLRSCVRCLLE